MKNFHLMSLATVVALAIVPVVSRGQTAATPVAPSAAAKPADCGKTTMKRHDHAAERSAGSMGMQKNKPCPPDASASAPKSTTKKGQRHDHAKFKNL